MSALILACRSASSRSLSAPGCSGGETTSVSSAGTLTGEPLGTETCTMFLPRAGALPTTVPCSPVAERTLWPFAIGRPCLSAGRMSGFQANSPSAAMTNPISVFASAFAPGPAAFAGAACTTGEFFTALSPPPSAP